MTKTSQRVLFGVGVLVCIACVLVSPKAAGDGALNGIMLCSKVVIPSLFPITFLTVMLCRISGGGVLSVWLLSLISGYPVGARLIKNRYEKGVIDQSQARHAMLFCVNAGPAFVVSAVGNACLGNIRLGWLLLAANMLGSLGVFLLFKKGPLRATARQGNPVSIGDAFIEAAQESSTAMLQICSWVILFSAFCAVLRQSPLPAVFKNSVLASAEITAAVSQYRSPILLSFLMGFGGFCVHLQVLSAGREIHSSYWKFLAARLLHGLFSAVACYLLLKCFPIVVEASKVFLSAARENQVASFCSLLFTLAVFVFSIKGVEIR